MWCGPCSSLDIPGMHWTVRHPSLRGFWAVSRPSFAVVCAMTLASPEAFLIALLWKQVIPAIPTSQQVDSSAEVVRALPMPMPEGVRGVGWAEDVWRQAGGVAKM